MQQTECIAVSDLFLNNLINLYDVTCRSYVAIPANSWVDDFIDWLNPGSKCCRLYTSGPDIGQFCPANQSENHL